MRALGKNVISTGFLISVLFTVHSCKKPKYTSAYEPKDFYGEWKLECKFWDTDSNGLDSGDVKYLANPKDSFTWYFRNDNRVDYRSAGKVMFTGQWALTLPNERMPVNELYIYYDFDYYSANYKIQQATSKSLIIYCKQIEYKFSQPWPIWYGWELTKMK
jgi:hypothetical protein